MKPILSTSAQVELHNIARTCLQIETLETRHGDSLDFHNLAVWQLKEALEAAYLAGMVGHHRQK